MSSRGLPSGSRPCSLVDFRVGLSGVEGLVFRFFPPPIEDAEAWIPKAASLDTFSSKAEINPSSRRRLLLRAMLRARHFSYSVKAGCALLDASDILLFLLILAEVNALMHCFGSGSSY